MKTKAQEDWKNTLEYTINRLKEVESWIDSEADPSIKQEMIQEFNYLLESKIGDALRSYFG